MLLDQLTDDGATIERKHHEDIAMVISDSHMPEASRSSLIPRRL